MQMIYDGIQVQVEPVETEYAMYNGYYGYYSIEPVITINTCFYCGNLLKRSTEQCPSCGARDWKRRRRGE